MLGYFQVEIKSINQCSRAYQPHIHTVDTKTTHTHQNSTLPYSGKANLDRASLKWQMRVGRDSPYQSMALTSRPLRKNRDVGSVREIYKRLVTTGSYMNF